MKTLGRPGFRSQIALMLVTMWLAAGCGSETPSAVDEEPAGLRIDVATRAVPGIGGSVALATSFIDTQGATLDRIPEGVAWSSDDPAIISVDASGNATGMAEGTTRIRAEALGLAADEQLWVVRDETGTVAITGATLLPMDGSSQLEDHTVIAVEGLITAMGPSGTVDIPAGAAVVDATGRYLIPGLTDAHTHPKDPLDLIPYLANGVTTVISLGHTPAQTPVLQWRDQVNAGSLLGPTIYATREILDGANPRAIATIVTTPAAGRAAVRDQVAAGVDFIKTYNDLSVPTFEAIMDEADALGVSVISHGVRGPGLDGILRGGVSAIAHAEEVFYTHFASVIDPMPMDDAVDAMVDAGVWLMPNLSTFERVTAQWGNTTTLDGWLATPEARFLGPWHTTNWRAFHQNAYASRGGSVSPILNFLSQITTASHDGGVPFLLATDSPIIPGLFPGYSVHDDLRLLVTAGLTREEALLVGTANGGRFISEYGPSDDPFGTIAVGARADLVLLDGDPRADLGTLRTPHGVMARGRYLSRYRLEQLLEDMAKGWGR